MSEIVHTPEHRHSCGVTGNGTWWLSRDRTGPPELVCDAAGTVRACTGCGRTWVAEWRTPGLAVSTWRPEGRLERWWRERRTRRSALPRHFS